MKNKEKYHELCVVEKTLPLFLQDWWLDAVSLGGVWDVALVESNGKIVAAMPYFIKRKIIFAIVSQPNLTQHLGPWMQMSPVKSSTKLTQQKEWMELLLKQIPKVDHYQSNWHHSISNWLPFFWAGYEQTTRYTYVIDDVSNQDAVWRDFQGSARTDIKKAKDRFKLRIKENPTIDDFYHIYKKTFERQKIKTPYDLDAIQKIDRACGERSCRKIFLAIDESGQCHAACYLVWFNNVAYYLMGGGDPDLRNSGAASFCIWEAIKFASTVANSFDFEGSMIEPVERFFRSFGAMQKPYFKISKTNSRLLKVMLAAKSIVQG